MINPKLQLLTLLLISIFIPTLTYSNDRDIADEYMKAYSQFDLNEMTRFYTTDARFRDPTSDMWGEHAWNIDEKYESGGHTIYTGKVKYSGLKAGELTTRCLLISTVVSVKDGKVVEHRDYIDYANFDIARKSGDQDC